MSQLATTRITQTGGRAATTRHIPPALALAVGMPTSAAPAGWRWRPLSELARLESGHTPSRRFAEYWGGSIPWISIPDAKRHHGGVIEDTAEKTNDLGIANSSARLLPAGTVCLSRTASVGYVVVMGRPMATSQDFVNWTCGDELVPEFLQYLLIAEGDGLLRFSSGAVHKTIYFPEVKAFHVCVPSVLEQRRIVAILDEAFEGIATAKANAEKNLQSARELFALNRAALFDEGRQSWCIKPLGEIAEVQSGGTPLVSTKEFWGGHVAWYSSGELKNIETSEPERFITEAGLAGSNAKLFPRGSLLIGMYDTAALKMSILDRAAAFNQAIAGVKPSQALDAEFLFHAINVQKPALLSLRRGVRQKNLSLGKIKEILVPVPGTEAQRKVVNRLREAQELSDHLAGVYQRKLEALDELKKSLLRQAFTGQLTSAKSTFAVEATALSTTSPEFSATIICLAYERHRRKQRDQTFGHVKEQKLLHLVEAIAKVDLGRQPIKDAAGPNDFQHQLNVENWARKQGHFDIVQRDGGYEFKRLSGFEALLARAPQVFGAYAAAIEAVIDLLIPMDTRQAEVLATVHAAWNNLLIDGAEVIDLPAIQEALKDWHPRKKVIQPDEALWAMGLIRAKGLVPDGTGKYVGGQQSLHLQ